MKTIKPVNVWVSGESKSATGFNMNSIFDNLEDSATFYYELLVVGTDEDGKETTQQVAHGNLQMDGDKYQEWNTAVDANEYAYIYGAEQLSLQIS